MSGLFLSVVAAAVTPIATVDYTSDLQKIIGGLISILLIVLCFLARNLWQQSQKTARVLDRLVTVHNIAMKESCHTELRVERRGNGREEVSEE